MMQKMLASLFLLCASFAAHACDITLSSGANLHAAVASYAGKRICLNTGTYNLGSATLDIPAGTRIEGLAASRDAVAINSSATRAIVPGNGVMLKNFLLNGPGASGEFGILSYQRSDLIVWGLRIQNFLISIGVNGSSNVDVWDTFMRYNGNLSNGIADPNVWITDANDVVILYGEVIGRANGPGGDGEVAAYNSTGVVIDGLHTVDVGASAMYMVNCDYCRISNTVTHRPGEWGIDVVSGSDYFQANNNSVWWANFGGAVFDEAGSIGGTFSNNSFNHNRRMGVGACNGINVIGNVTGVSQSGNTSTPAGVICKFN
jgi:hypothetical protein